MRIKINFITFLKSPSSVGVTYSTGESPLEHRTVGNSPKLSTNPPARQDLFSLTDAPSSFTSPAPATSLKGGNWVDFKPKRLSIDGVKISRRVEPIFNTPARDSDCQTSFYIEICTGIDELKPIGM